MTNASVATSESWKEPGRLGRMQERTEWHRVVFRDRGIHRLPGRSPGEYAEVGKAPGLCRMGLLRTRKWRDQSGQDRHTTEILVNEMQMLDSCPAGATHEQSSVQLYSQPAPAKQQGGALRPPAASDFLILKTIYLPEQGSWAALVKAFCWAPIQSHSLANCCCARPP